MMEEHKALSKEKRREIEELMVKARKVHEKEREEHRKQRKIIIKERMKLHDSLKDKHGNVFIMEDDDMDENEFLFRGKNKTMFIVDGEESDEAIIDLISPENIANVNVLKGEHAIKMYGDKGKNGVIVIKTKPHGENNFVYEFEHELDEPNVEFIVDPNMELEWVSEFNNIEINTIDKNTTDAELKALKSELKSKNIDFSFSKLRRNKSDEITRIKVSLNDNEGNKSSSTFDKGNKSISPVIIGKNRKNLIIKSI